MKSLVVLLISIVINALIIMFVWNNVIHPVTWFNTITFWDAVLLKVFVAALVPLWPSGRGR